MIPSPEQSDHHKPLPKITPSAALKGKSPVVFRVALLCAVGAAFALFLMRQGGPSAAEAKRTDPSGAELWLKEIDAYVSRIPCRFPDNIVAAARAQELPKSIERWEELARIEPSEYLKSLIRIQELAACFPTVAAPHGESVKSASARLRAKLTQRIRTQYALLVRAQKQGERQEALRTLHSLQVLLSAHEGPARAHLEKLAQHFK